MYLCTIQGIAEEEGRGTEAASSVSEEGNGERWWRGGRVMMGTWLE